MVKLIMFSDLIESNLMVALVESHCPCALVIYSPILYIGWVRYVADIHGSWMPTSSIISFKYKVYVKNHKPLAHFSTEARREPADLLAIFGAREGRN